MGIFCIKLSLISAVFDWIVFDTISSDDKEAVILIFEMCQYVISIC